MQIASAQGVWASYGVAVPAAATTVAPVAIAEPAGAQGEADPIRRLDFTSLSTSESKALGRELFHAGHITLDELFKFEHPAGRLLVQPDGSLGPGELPGERHNLLRILETDLHNLRATGEALNPQSPYRLYEGLLAKLRGWQGQTVGVDAQA